MITLQQLSFDIPVQIFFSLLKKYLILLFLFSSFDLLAFCFHSHPRDSEWSESHIESNNLQPVYLFI
jgi:hypothetical protein